METKARSLTKTLTWRILATLLTWAVAYAFTGSIIGSLELTLVAAILSTMVYYIHERVWNKVSWGKK